VLDDVDRAITLLSGPLMLAGLTGTVALDERLIDEVIGQFLAGQAAALIAAG
jgi:hypothetical protein